MCFNGKNLYNSALFELRQVYFHNKKHKKRKKFPKYSDYAGQAKYSDDFKELPAKVAQLAVKRAFDDVSNFFKSLKAYSKNPTKFKAVPKLPSYKHSKHGRQLVVFNNQAVSSKWYDGTIQLSGCTWTIPFHYYESCAKLCEVRIVPRLGYYVIEIVYQCPVLENDDTMVCGIDPGLNNLVTVAFKHRPALIISGKPIKAINAYYNGLISDKKSKLPKGIYTSQHIQSLWRNRLNKIKDYMHKASDRLLKILSAEGIKTIIIGHNKDQKQRSKLKNFVQVPRTMFNTMLKYKAEEYGMEVILTEESFTSKASALDGDVLPTKRGEHNFSGKRIKRGLYRTKDKTLINADANAALNIMRKVGVSLKVRSDRLKGFVVTPESLPISYGW